MRSRVADVMSHPRLAVIIVNFNTREWLARCLRSLERQTIRDELEIIIVDNASSDDSIQMVRSEFPACTLLPQDENDGFGGANNIGARQSAAPTLLFLNPDTEVRADDSLEEFLEAFEPEAMTAIGAGILYDEVGELERSTGTFPTVTSLALDRLLAKLPVLRASLGRRSERHWSDFTQRRQVDWVTAAAIWVRRTAFEALDGFDEEIFMYYEDVDLCYRARSAGMDCMYYPVGAITHFRNKAPTSKGRKQLQRKWLGYFCGKHYRTWHQSPTRLAFTGLCWISRSP